MAPPSESEEIYRESRSGQGASLAGKSHARKKICTVLEKVTFRTAKGRNAPFFHALESTGKKKNAPRFCTSRRGVRNALKRGKLL